MNYRKDIIDVIIESTDIKNLKNEIIEHTPVIKNISKSKPLILILCNSCNGFGDIVFAVKLMGYLREWYDAEVHILTTRPQDFAKVGETHNIYKLITKREDQCRRFSTCEVPKEVLEIVYDLLFIAPLQADFTILQSDIKAIIPYSNKWNTYFFSEYNDDKHKPFDFPTGVGGNRLGLLFTSLDKEPERRKDLVNPYAVVYVAESIPRVVFCYLSFFNMVVKKYVKEYKNLDIVVPGFIADQLIGMKNNCKLDFIKKNYPNIIVKTKKEKISFQSEKETDKNTITFRGDIYPIPNIEMKALMIFSLEDILITGDQSLTDALSCCHTKNIWYQQASWKLNLAKNLSNLLPQKYFSHKKTTCGTIEAVNYKSNYEDFFHTWDFRKLGKEKLDKVVSFTILKKDILDILEIINKSHTTGAVKKKLTKIL